MSVYFIGAPEVGLVKIGYAEQPKGRLGKAQVDSPTRLILLAVIDGSVTEERQLHSRFADLRARGEWFRNEGALAEYIATLTPYAQPERLTFRKIAKASGISVSYLSELVTNAKPARIPVLIHIFRSSGWRHPHIAEMTEQEMQAFEKYDRWSPPAVKAA